MNDGKRTDYSISLIRFIATASIIACHMFQFYKHELMWWLNVGVQIFFCMSGFLYGRKGVIEDNFKFYKKTFTKVLVDYYIVAIPMFIILTVLFVDKFSIVSMIQVLFTKAVMEGGEHLWYVSYCLFCYLCTPLLSRFFDRYKDRRIVISFVVLCWIVVALVDLFFYYFIGAWLFCYILGFFLGVISSKGKTKLYNTVCLVIIAFAIISNTVQIILDYIVKLELNDANGIYYAKMCNYAHVALGTSLFLLLKKLFTAIFKKGYPKPIQKFCALSDRYSYDIYLVHQFFILGPLSLMALTNIPALNIIIILAVIILLAVIVNLLSNLIRKPLKKLINT